MPTIAFIMVFVSINISDKGQRTPVALSPNLLQNEYFSIANTTIVCLISAREIYLERNNFSHAHEGGNNIFGCRFDFAHKSSTPGMLRFYR